MEVKIRHHSQERVFREPFGAVECGQDVLIRLQISEVMNVDMCYLRLWDTGLKQEKLFLMRLLENDNFEEVAEEYEVDPAKTDLVIENKNQTSFWFEVKFKAPTSPGLVWYFLF